MLGLIFLFVTGVIGARQTSLSWRPFATLAGFVAILVPLQTAMKVSARARMGEDASALWDPFTVAGNWAFGFVLYAVVFLLGYGVSKWRRRSKPKS